MEITNYEDVEEILERNVVGIGTGAHINIPLKHKGKGARIIIFREIPLPHIQKKLKKVEG